jgi:DNA-directed RNA polymerase alpha subunit
VTPCSGTIKKNTSLSGDAKRHAIATATTTAKQGGTEKRTTVVTHLRANCATQRNTQKEFPLGRNNRLNMTNDPEADILNLPVSYFNFSVRARKCFRKLNVETIGDLVAKSAEDLIECKNFGVTSLNEVREKLRDRGLSLRDDT